MSDLGRILVTLGAVLLAAGLIILLLGRLNLPIGRLPGDMTWRGRNWTISFPLATSILLSVALTLLLWLISYFRR